MDGGRTLKNYAKDEVIFSQGEPADAVFYIQKGKVKLIVASKQGKQAVVAILGGRGLCNRSRLHRRYEQALVLGICRSDKRGSLLYDRNLESHL